ncbi:MAG: sodium/proton antiporter NhaB [Flavobacteriales bacterium]|nr:MAG: sodium/proton antiporter NhaB [Flavobacteriales bacterium]
MLQNFLGNSPKWFKGTIVGILIINTLLFFGLPMIMDHHKALQVLSWLFIGEFIFTLAMALKCYPLQSGGLLAIQILVFGLTSPDNAYHEVSNNLEVILLLIFMVAGIYFMKPLLMYIFSKVFVNIKSKLVLSFSITLIAAILSAFLDALTVTAVLISVFVGFYGIYHKIVSNPNTDINQDGMPDSTELKENLKQFRGFLRSLMMHGVVGTALGGVSTLVGEPQNLLIGEKMDEDFVSFFLHMAPVSMPVLVCGLATTLILEKLKIFGYGTRLPKHVREILELYTIDQSEKMTKKEKNNLMIQGIAAILLVASLALHLAPVGFIGLAIIIIQTSFMGITHEHALGKAFEESLPFTALLVVFFVVVSMIHDQHLFQPIIEWALSQPIEQQPAIFYVANGALSAISDNVFVATVYINEVFASFSNGDITQEHLNKLAVAINTGTNLPSVATPNGQAAFLFLLTSSLAPLIKLSYGKMIKMALPYTIVLGGVGLLCVYLFI